MKIEKILKDWETQFQSFVMQIMVTKTMNSFKRSMLAMNASEILRWFDRARKHKIAFLMEFDAFQEASNNSMRVFSPAPTPTLITYTFSYLSRS